MTQKHSLIATLLSMVLTLGGAVMFIVGLAFGYLIAVSPFLVIGIFAIFGIVFYAFRDRINMKEIRAELRSMRQGVPRPPPVLPLPPPPDEAKKEEKKPKRITIELE